ncbi:MAG: hypothetical protein JRJ66_11950 [Deltaproteobacteria bacterium]|nr:hypothetical protein [Deltaproteobacteria bacterium]MBW1934421.1 hypothetical protein [Deltaproteobacteria bacterium]MBW2045002.1 hypothetical protein [Deltaproteobacteria bacterium]RLB34807.1 MAG: hypothetical protein DRH11_04775 [Deltaproteobacteria bacterium]
MPLGFQSINFGTIAFGFFNIDTDLLLLEHYFLFADDFCQYIKELDAGCSDEFETAWEVYDIAGRNDIGDLMGAIHGVRYTGFIGDVYKRFPFPLKQEDFKQKPDGLKNREVVLRLLEKYATKKMIRIVLNQADNTVRIGEYLFSRGVFQELLEYVWLGGYPRWKEGVRPAYVLEMKKAVEKRKCWVFKRRENHDHKAGGTG